MAQKIETIQNNITKIELWTEKKTALINKKLEKVQKAGYAIGITSDDLFNRESRKNHLIDSELHRAIADQAKDAILNEMWNLVGCGIPDDFQSKQRELKRLKKTEAEMLEALEKLTPEQIEQKEKREKEIALRAYIRDEMDSIKIPTLDAWLENYRIAYVEMVEKYLTGWEKSDALRKTDQAVRDQKMNILIRTFEKVGKLEAIQFGVIGMNGEFNGTVRGEHGIANIRTIMAGGYNIQCLHYRVLVN